MEREKGTADIYTLQEHSKNAKLSEEFSAIDNREMPRVLLFLIGKFHLYAEVMK
jgi:hypothetical protein